jgi:allantoicase
LCNDADEVNLAAAELGASAVYANDSFFGHHDNLLVPTLPRNMGEGWETRRRRGPAGFDWVVVKLAGPGRVDRVVVDTMFFKGNYPATVAIDLASFTEEPVSWASVPDSVWTEALPESPLSADAPHEFPIQSPAVATHVRMRIAPDGGVARLQIHGIPVQSQYTQGDDVGVSP